MDTKSSLQTYIVQPVMLPIIPTTGPYLPDPNPIDAAFSATTQKLNVAMTFMLPAAVNPSLVTVKQYFNSNDTSKLYFFVEYSTASTTQSKPVPCTFKASAVDGAGNPIELGAILSISTLLVNSVGPKSSRGVMTTVRTTEQ